MIDKFCYHSRLSRVSQSCWSFSTTVRVYTVLLLDRITKIDSGHVIMANVMIRPSLRPFQRCPECFKILSTTYRPLSTSHPQLAFGAPPISFADPAELPPPTNLKYARVVPASSSYFTAFPRFSDDLLHLTQVLQRHSSLPTVPPSQAKRVAWRTLPDYRLKVGEPIKAARYHKIISILQRLNRIYPPLMPPEVLQAMQPYKRDLDPYKDKSKPRTLDELGRAFGKGRRKTSSARAYLVEGRGEMLVNGKKLHDVFQRVHDRESAMWALKSTGRIDKYNVWALVNGGGTTGQAESLTLAVAKALLVHEPALKPALRRGNLLLTPN